MLCDICKKNNATILITKIVNGEKKELNVCEYCAKEKTDFFFGEDLDFINKFSFQNILSDIMDYVNENKKEDIIKTIVCNNCGTTLEEFKKTGLLGCDNCYNEFSSNIESIAKRLQGSIEHKGKIPLREGKMLVREKHLTKLKFEMQKVIEEENFERAAEIRDEIKRIESEGNYDKLD